MSHPTFACALSFSLQAALKESSTEAWLKLLLFPNASFHLVNVVIGITNLHQLTHSVSYGVKVNMPKVTRMVCIDILVSAGLTPNNDSNAPDKTSKGAPQIIPKGTGPSFLRVQRLVDAVSIPLPTSEC